jgi:hypothetical protein
LRDYKLYLHDVKEAVEKIETFTKGYTFENSLEMPKQWMLGQEFGTIGRGCKTYP